MKYSLNGIHYMLRNRIGEVTSPKEGGEYRDSAILNYIKQWLEWRYLDLHQQEILVDDVYLTLDNTSSVKQPRRVDLIIKFEVKIRDIEDGYARWKYGKLDVPFSDNRLDTDFDSGLETCIISSMERWIEQARPYEYLTPSDFLDIQGGE